MLIYLKKLTLILFLQYPHQIGSSCLKKLTLLAVNTSADFERQVHSQVGSWSIKRLLLTSNISFIFTYFVLQVVVSTKVFSFPHRFITFSLPNVSLCYPVVEPSQSVKREKKRNPSALPNVPLGHPCTSYLLHHFLPGGCSTYIKRTKFWYASLIQLITIYWYILIDTSWFRPNKDFWSFHLSAPPWSSVWTAKGKESLNSSGLLYKSY